MRCRITDPMKHSVRMTCPAVAGLVVAAVIGSGGAAGGAATVRPLRTLVTVSLPGEPANPVLVGGSVWLSIVLCLRRPTRGTRTGLARVR